MGKKSRRRDRRSTHTEVATRNQNRASPDSGATSRPGSPMPYRTERKRSGLSAYYAERRAAPARQTRPARKAVPTIQDLFGTWTLPTPQARKTNATKSVCEAREDRRRAIFATHRTGAGAAARRLNFTNRRCK